MKTNPFLTRYVTWCNQHKMSALLVAQVILLTLLLGPILQLVPAIMLLVFLAAMAFLLLKVRGTVLALVVAIGLQSAVAAEPPQESVAVPVTVWVSAFPEESMVVPITVGVCVVAGVTGFCIWAINYCQKYYNKPKTNAPPEEFWLTAASGEDYAASDVWQSGYCFEEASDGLPRVTMVTMTMTATSSNVVLSDFGFSTQEAALTLSQFRREMMAQHGLEFSFGTHYALNGRHAQQGEVPILFPVVHGDVPHVTLHPSPDNVTTVIYRSFDLVAWTAFLTNNAPPGLSFTVNDASEHQSAFYRASVL